MCTKLMRNRPVSLLLLFIVFFSSAQICHGENTINIGVIGPMAYTHGHELWNGALLAAEKVNHNGGVLVGNERMRIRLIKVDSNEYLNVATATNAIEMLFFRNNVDFVVGGFRSEAVLAMQDVAMDHKKIFISAGAAAPQLTERVAQNYKRYKYYFRGGTFNNFDLGKACFLQLGYVAQNLKAELKTKQIKVAIAAERNRWVDGMIAAAKFYFPRMGLELAGVFRPSSVATDVSPTLKAIADTNAPLILTLFSGNVGVSFVSQAADLNIPAIMVGINAEAQKKNFWAATGGKADNVITLTAFAPNVEISDQTKPFVDKYTRRFGDLPNYTAGGTYIAIAYTLTSAIEQAGTLNPEILIPIIENSKIETPQGHFALAKDDLGRHLHEVKFGAGYVLPLAVQWQNGQMKGIWPNNYQERPGTPTLTYKGVVNFKIPDWVIKRHKRF